jgi:hypothetical protein
MFTSKDVRAVAWTLPKNLIADSPCKVSNLPSRSSVRAELRDGNTLRLDCDSERVPLSFFSHTQMTGRSHPFNLSSP